MNLETKIKEAKADFESARQRYEIACNAANLQGCREKKGDLMVYRVSGGAREALRLNGNDAEQVLDLIEKLLNAQL
jgi:hypothetical protein